MYSDINLYSYPSLCMASRDGVQKKRLSPIPVCVHVYIHIHFYIYVCLNFYMYLFLFISMCFNLRVARKNHVVKEPHKIPKLRNRALLQQELLCEKSPNKMNIPQQSPATTIVFYLAREPWGIFSLFFCNRALQQRELFESLCKKEIFLLYI